MTKRHTKINKTQLDQVTQRFNAFLKGETQIIADEAFQNAVQSYMEVFLKSDRVIKMVTSGCATQFDFKEVFRTNIEKRVRSLPEIEGISKETVLTSWLAKFDILLKGSGDEENKRPTRLQPNLNSELILNKEQLYDMFQQILGVKKFEHQILYNALMVSILLLLFYKIEDILLRSIISSAITSHIFKRLRKKARFIGLLG